MPVAFDPNPSFSAYAHPERLVSASWLSAHLGTPGLKVVESDEDPLHYDIGHIPGAVRIDWRRELNDPLSRDILNPEAFAKLMDQKGIARDDTVVVYGDKSNSWAAFTVWVFELYGHQDVRLLDGGRDSWMAEERDTSFVVPNYPATGYPISPRDDAPIRAFVKEIHGVITADSTPEWAIVDVRSPTEYSGDIPDSSPESGVFRNGHIPGALNVLWENSVHANSRFRSRSELESTFSAIPTGAKPVVYCYHGQRAAHSWFVLKYLLGNENARVYDGSWAEWGNMIKMPIRKGPDPDNLEMSLEWTGTHLK